MTTSTGEPASARAVASPPKPAPTMTTRGCVFTAGMLYASCRRPRPLVAEVPCCGRVFDPVDPDLACLCRCGRSALGRGVRQPDDGRGSDGVAAGVDELGAHRRGR